MTDRCIQNRRVALMLAGTTFILTTLMLAARGSAWNAWVYQLTALASLGFVLTGLAGSALCFPYGRWMLLGLVGCMAGDLLGPRNFVFGALAFLAAHLAFIAAFLTQGLTWRTMRKTAAIALAIGLAVALWLLPHVPRPEMPLVVGYMLVISLMVSAASATNLSQGKWLLISGAWLFYVSDIFVARWKYVTPDGFNAYLCLPLYYTACILLALSIAYAPLQTACRTAPEQPQP